MDRLIILLNSLKTEKTMDVTKHNNDVLENLYSHVEGILKEDTSPQRKKEIISEIIKDAKVRVSDRNSHIFANQLKKIKQLFEQKIDRTHRELSRHLRALLSEIHNYLPHYHNAF